MQTFPFFHTLAILLFSQMVVFMINWQKDFVLFNSVCYHTRGIQIGLQLRGRPITDLDYTQCYYHYLSLGFRRNFECAPKLFEFYNNFLLQN